MSQEQPRRPQEAQHPIQHGDDFNVSGQTQPGRRVDTEAGGSQGVQQTSNQPAQAAADKPVEQSDVAALQAAEMRATGRNEITPGGLAEMAQRAAAYNAQCNREEDKIKMSDITSGRLPVDNVFSQIGL